MGRKMKDKHSNSFWVNNHHPHECNKTLFHIIKYHPLLSPFFERLAYKSGGGDHERSVAGNVPVLSANGEKELNLETRNTNDEKEMTPYSSVSKDHTVRSKLKTIVLKEISKKRSTRHHRSSTCPSLPTINMNKNLLRTFVQDPVSPLLSHFHKQHVYGTKMKLTRSVSLPLPNSSSSKRQSFGDLVNDYYLPKGKGKVCFENNKTPKSSDQFQSSKKLYLRSMSMSSGAKCFNVNEAMMARDVVNCSSGSGNQNEIKQFKNLKQKIEHVTGESRKEKLRVAMDAVVHKLPQGHEISDGVKKEFFKKLTDSNITREGDQYYPERCNNSDHSSPSFTKHAKHNIRRKLSLQEPLEVYYELHHENNSFNNAEPRSIKLRSAERAHSPLRMFTPLQRMLSLPDYLPYFSSNAYQNGEFFPDISSVTDQPKPIIMASGDGTVSSDNISHQKKRPGLNSHSKVQLQSDTTVENLIKKHLVSVEENDLVISNIIEPGSDCSCEIMTTDDFGLSCLKNGGTYNDQDIDEAIKEFMTGIATPDPKLNMGPRGKLDNMAEQQEAMMDSLKVKKAIENAQNVVEIQTKQLNHDIPLYHVDTEDKDEYNYVRYILEISGLTGKDSISAWHSSDHPVDPLLYEEMESDPDFCSYDEGSDGQCNHHVLFDFINETLLELSGRSYCYCTSIPLSSSSSSSSSDVSHTRRHHPMLRKAWYHGSTLHQVWTHMSKSLCLRSEVGLTIDGHVSRDQSRRDGWVNPQLFAQCVGLEVEDLIFHDLLEEIACDLACI